MSSSANRRRVFLLSLFSLLTVSVPGCIATDPATKPTDVSLASPSDTTSVDSIVDAGEGIASAETLASADAAAPAQVAAVTSMRSMVTPNDAGIGIEVGEGVGVNQIAIQTSDGNPRYEVTKLSSPPRLVIDLAAGQVSANRNVPISDLEYVSGIRLGSHADKSRIVLDLPATAEEISHTEEIKDGRIIVTLAGTQQGSEALAQANLANADMVAPTGDTSAIDSETPLVPVADTNTMPSDSLSSDVTPQESLSETADSNIQPELPSGEPALDTVAASSADTQETAVTALSLEKAGALGSRIVARVEGSPEFALEKTAPSEYVLTVQKSALQVASTGTTIVAPPSESGIRTVRAVSEGDNVQLRIFAQPGTTLEARRDGSTIMVEPSIGGAEDMRAQLDPDATKTEEPSAVPATGSDTTTGGSKVTISEKAAPPIQTDDLGELLGDSSKYTGRLISLDLQDTDIDNALRIIAEVSNLNIVASEDVTGKVTLRLIDVPWDQALDVILKTNGLDKVLEGNVMRIAPVDKLRQEREALKQSQEAEEELEPLNVKYLRVSYAKAAELKPLIETVLSERGSVAYDDRSNQLIIKDSKKGLKNVVELVNKIDLRTPQVLLETQIVEASRTLIRDLGAQLGFNYTASPSTGNATGWNFPNSVNVGGSGDDGSFSSFPAQAGASALSLLFGSADGTKSLDLALTQLEREGRVRVISRPAVATTNNKPAQIKSVEKIRVKLPQGGTSVATGAGAVSSASGSAATETFEIGITLDVTPQASPDYFVLMDIKAKSSTFGSERVDGIPSELERSANSTVLVSSGQTFALGGIYKIRDEDSVEGVPFFKDIPVLGHLFRRMQTNNSDEELLFFLTPRIVEGSFDDAAMKAGS